LCPALLAALAHAQSGFEWDYPDGLGVRYLLYDRIERTEFKPKAFPQEMRALFQPKSKSDWVRIKGTPLAWGMHVYEFAGDAGFGEFLQERDPRRTFREFRVDGRPLTSKGRDGRYWEFVDTWRPLLEVLDRPQPGGPYRFVVSPELQIRFVGDKTMQYVDPFVASDGDNCFARLHPAPKEWLRIDGVPGPVAWMIKLCVFPDLPRAASSSDRDDTVASFAAFVDERDPQRRLYAREVTVRDQPVEDGKTPHRLWQWIDRRSDGKSGVTPSFQVVAAVYELDGRQVALMGVAPAESAEVPPEPLANLARMVTSVERWAGKATEPGFAFYNVAASCRLGDREVGMLVHIPMGTAAQPDRKLYDAARRMVQSLTPVEGK
jgi:hypothetical protein